MRLDLRENFTSENLYNKLKLLEVSTLKQFTNGMVWCKDNNIKRVIVGGTAVVNYLPNGRDLTPDIDYLVADINDVKNKLKKDNIYFKNITDYKGENLGITVPDFNIDFLTQISDKKIFNETALRTSKSFNIGGESEQIIAPEVLALAKLNLGREKDLRDGISLLQHGKLNKNVFEKLVELFKPHLNDYELTKELSNLIK